ncbi:MAG: helix-turn-helix transcriptional regulator [Oscillospiraceae bacterium]|nr:helix-turn-helix transcriptional regulator [Oscillospiraceae bacterium]
MSLLSDNLRRLRAAHSLTQPALAAKLGISRSAVAMYENGSREPELSLLCAMADLYGVTLDALCGREFPLPDADLKQALFDDPNAGDDLLEDVRAYAQFQHRRRS